MSIADLLDAGHRVVFDRGRNGENASYCEHKGSNIKIPVKERQRTFELEMQLAPMPKGFRGQP